MGGYDGVSEGAQTDFIVPQLIINGEALNRVHGPAQTQVTGGETQWFFSIIDVQGDMYYDSQHDLYHLFQPRSNGDQAGWLIVDANLDGDATGNTPIVLFNSREWTRDHGMDGAIGQAALGGVPPETDRNGEDIFRQAATGEVSADGSTMFLRRNQVIGTVAGTGTNENPILGPSSGLGFEVLEIPLDAMGLPIIDIDDMGTPTDTTDDRITNFSGFNVAGTGAPSRHELEFDAAGNAYTTHSNIERLQVFSPGGNWTAITTSAGEFSLVPFVPPVGGVDGDYNDDGTVDAADYVLWRKGVSPLANDDTPGNQPEDYDVWKEHFGESAPGSGGNSQVPEPSALLLAAVGLLASGACRRRHA